MTTAARTVLRRFVSDVQKEYGDRLLKSGERELTPPLPPPRPGVGNGAACAARSRP
jgi:hypothetical protein